MPTPELAERVRDHVASARKESPKERYSAEELSRVLHKIFPNFDGLEKHTKTIEMQLAESDLQRATKKEVAKKDLEEKQEENVKDLRHRRIDSDLRERQQALMQTEQELQDKQKKIEAESKLIEKNKQEIARKKQEYDRIKALEQELEDKKITLAFQAEEIERLKNEAKSLHDELQRQKEEKPESEPVAQTLVIQEQPTQQEPQLQEKVHKQIQQAQTQPKAFSKVYRTPAIDVTHMQKYIFHAYHLLTDKQVKEAMKLYQALRQQFTQLDSEQRKLIHQELLDLYNDIKLEHAKF